MSDKGQTTEEAGTRLGIKLRPDEVDKLKNMAKQGNKRQSAIAKAMLHWVEGSTISYSAGKIGRTRATIAKWRQSFKLYGFQVFHDTTRRSNLQALSAKLLEDQTPVSTEQIQQLALAHLAQLMPDGKTDDNATRAKVVNDCLALLLKCNATKTPATGGIEKAIAAAMGNGSDG